MKYLDGKMVKALRIQKGLSQVQLAAALNISNSAVSHWECGRSKPNPELQTKLYDFFGLVVAPKKGELPKVTKPKATVEVEKTEAPKEDSAWVVYALTVIGAAIALMLFIREVGI